MEGNNPFKDLKKDFKAKKKEEKRQAKAARKAANKAASAVPKPPKPNYDDDMLFSRAMTGVAPMQGKGRDLPKSAPPVRPHAAVDQDDAAREKLKKVTTGEEGFDLEYTDEFMRGYVRGLDMKIVNQLKSGSYSYEDHLDLHGMTLDQATDAILFFLRESYLAGKRCVLLIPGRGKNSPFGEPVLKRELQYTLTKDPLRRIVLAFCTAIPKHGGAGALYVLLRKVKKTKGKVAFDRTEFFGDEF